MARTTKVNRKLLNEFHKLEQVLKQIPIELAPFSKEELGLISFHSDMKKSSGWINKVTTGAVTTIYQEYLGQYVFRSYYFAAVSSMLYVRTTKYEFGYIFGRKKCDLFINEQYAGSISRKGELIGPKGRRVLLRASQQFDRSVMIKILDKEVALINYHKEDDLSIARMLAWEDTETIEEVLLVASICFLRNIMMAIPHPSLQGYLRT